MKASVVCILTLYPLLFLVGANCGKQIETAEDAHFDVGSGLLDSSSAIRKVATAFGEVKVLSGRSALVSSAYTSTLEQFPTSSTQRIHDEIKIRNIAQTEIAWSRVGKESNESPWSRLKELVGLGSGRDGVQDRIDKGSIKLDSGRYILSVSVAGIESVKEHSDLESSVASLEQSVGHRLLVVRIAAGLDLPFPPSTTGLKHLGTTACYNGVTCDVFEWRPEYYGERLTYRAYLNSVTGGLMRLTEKFSSGEKSRSYLVDEFSAIQ